MNHYKSTEIMSTEQIEKLYEEIKNTNHPLVEKVTAFHNFHKNYTSGHGDVISGLRRMDAMEEEINNLMKATNHSYDLMELGKKHDALKKEYDALKILCDHALAIKFIAEAQRDKLLSDLNSALDTIKREFGTDRADVRHYKETIESINKRNCKNTLKLL